MITKPTLFILGAGASIPYGFPSGWDLRSEICAATSINRLGALQVVTQCLRITQQEVHDFVKCFKHSSIASIDAFLSKRPEFSEIGKALIASLLIPRELVTRFNRHENDDDWYFWLWNALVSDVSKIDELSQNNVSIFTFNYDRSLEAFLHNSIMHTFNVSEDEALKALKLLNIQHVYGSLGEYGLKEDNDLNIRPYNAQLDPTNLMIAANSIKVIPEARADDLIFIKVKEAFCGAKHICFLGFGFDPLNVRRLGFHELINSLDTYEIPSRVVASAYGKTIGEIELAKDLLLGESIPHDDYGREVPRWDFERKESLQTLREFAWLLQ